jgi:hypothetical protein
MKKSSLLTTFPNGVLIAMRPDPVPRGTLVAIVVAVAELTAERALLNTTLLLATVISKLVPVMVTAVPGVPIVGLNPVIVGAPVAAVTVKGVLLVVEPVGVATVIGPVVAPDGTVVTICVAVAESAVASKPLNATEFSLGIVLNPVPCIVTDVPTGALFGVNSMIEVSEEFCRDIERRLLPLSYVYVAVSADKSTTAMSLPNSS